MKKPEAKQKLRAILQEMSVNDDAHLERTDAGARTFSSEAEWWKQNRLPMFKLSCQQTMGSHLEKYLMPKFGSLSMLAIDERRVQEFIVDLTRTEYAVSKGRRRKLSPKSIRNIVGVLKLIVVPRRDDLCMKQSPVSYDPIATCPVWEAAMNKWMCGDKEFVACIQAALGVTLTSDMTLQALFFNQGTGANGKDTFLTAFEYVMGDYWRNVDFLTFAETKNHSEHRNDLAVLAGAVRMVTTAESRDGHMLDEGVIKQVTGCSPRDMPPHPWQAIHVQPSVQVVVHVEVWAC